MRTAVRERRGNGFENFRRGAVKISVGTLRSGHIEDVTHTPYGVMSAHAPDVFHRPFDLTFGCFPCAAAGHRRDTESPEHCFSAQREQNNDQRNWSNNQLIACTSIDYEYVKKAVPT